VIRISEIFGPTIQGEGTLIGQPTIFVRTGGCDYRCDWCDTLHAVDSEFRHTWKPMTAEYIFAEVEKLSGNKPLMISLSGGNPAIQPLKPLIDLGHAKNYTFALETQGSIAADWFEDLDVLTLSPKPPSSKMTTDWSAFDACLTAAQNKPDIAMKIVIKDDADYDYARDAATRYPHLPLYLQPVNHTPSKDETAKVDIDGIMTRMRWLVDKIAADQWYDARLLPQLHVLMWGNLKGV
jgi:7-carboxy-7-deazaguanine synthase